MKVLFTITFVIGLIFGLAFVFIPSLLLDTYGIDYNAAANAIARNSGTAILAFAALAWFGRSSSDIKIQNIVIKTMFVYWLLSSITILIAQVSGVFNNSGWATVGLHISLLVAYGIFLFRKSKI